MRTRRPAWVGLLLTLPLIGCGETPTYRVAGEVTWQGTPVEDGQINFLPEDGNLHPATAKIVNGRYEARVPAGRMKVEVHGQKDLGFNPAMHQNTKAPYIPAEYNAETTLTLEVQPRDNTADFHLPLPK
jgi:hypothetical protein